MKRLLHITNLLAGFCVLSCAYPEKAQAQLSDPIPAGQTVLTFVNRLIINPPQVPAFGYFTGLTGLPDPLFSAVPGEATAYFTWYLNAPGALQIQNGDAAMPGSTSVAVLPAGESLSVYYNATPNQSWTNPGSFSAGQLIATFKSIARNADWLGPCRACDAVLCSCIEQAVRFQRRDLQSRPASATRFYVLYAFKQCSAGRFCRATTRIYGCGIRRRNWRRT